MVEDGTFSHKISIAILLNENGLPISGASSVKGLQSMGLPRLVIK